MKYPGFFYLGSPYSKYPDGIEAAFRVVCAEAGRLIAAGIPIFSPIAHTHPITILTGMDPYAHDIWIPADRPLMDAACGLIILRMESWEDSKGLQIEEEIFRGAGKPVVYMDPGIIPELPA